MRLGRTGVGARVSEAIGAGAGEDSAGRFENSVHPPDHSFRIQDPIRSLRHRRRRKVRVPSDTNRKENAMRKLAALAVATGLGLSSVCAQAMPFWEPTSSGDPMISQVAYGCGAGWTRGPYGHCRP